MHVDRPTLGVEPRVRVVGWSIISFRPAGRPVAEKLVMPKYFNLAVASRRAALSGNTSL